MSENVTGLMVKYYHTCHRELWFYMNDIDVDRSKTGIMHGSDIDERSYSGKRRRVFIDGTIAIDVLDDDTVVEVKRSSRMEEAGIMQLKYYLWYLKTHKGVEMDGEMAYPKERKRTRVELTAEDETTIEEIVTEIERIGQRERPPEPERKPFCDSCAYYDLCWV